MPREVAVARSEPLGLFVEATFENGAFVDVRILRGAETTAPHPLLDWLLLHIERGEGALSELPVDLSRLPPFHRDVLERLRRIPRGRVVTYGALAREMGSPGASRAVGGACAANPLPLVVPCHRVVGSDGSLGNYSGEGGAATKRALLEIEGAIARQGRLF